ncbi:MAG: class I SAM-dependent methyltransferase [Oligoflexia bacterium]|nr:class I SAM-dependent methyltransferase [Oligoflexia bacterium]
MSSEKNTIRETLLKLDIISKDNIEIFSNCTRDNKSLDVYRDKVSKVIFIDDYYTGREEYTDGKYRQRSGSPNGNLENINDSERRFNKYRQFIVSKSIIDFGCGTGSFLKLINPVAKSIAGIELQKDLVESLNADGIACFSSLCEAAGEQDSAFMFHCLEHLPDPVKALKEIYKKLRHDGLGKIIIEVPHARDFLIDKLSLQAFIRFTLWSQHLILHTRESLTKTLIEAGYKNIQVEGIQRYSIANHLHWLSTGQPGGHKEILSTFETINLMNAYAEALSRIDATDTLVAVAST